MRARFRLSLPSLLTVALLTGTLPLPLPAQQPRPPAPRGPGPGPVRPPIPGSNPGAPAGSVSPTAAGTVADEGIRLQMPAAQMGDIVELYQQLTKKRVIRDPKLEEVTVSIETSGTLSHDEAVEFIEKSLLLAGYSFVPSGGNMVKLLAADQGTMPAREGVPMFLRAEELPKTDQVVSYVLQLKHLDAEEASQAFTQIIPLHSYGSIGVVPNSRSLVITDNSNTILAYVELARQVDLPPSETTSKTIHLKRADVLEVTEQLVALMGLDQPNAGGGGMYSKSSASRTQTPRPGATPPNVAPQVGNPQQTAARNAAHVNVVANVGTNSAESDASIPRLQPIPRTNSLLVIARPVDIEYMESLIEQLDAESPTSTMMSRRLNYIDLTTFIGIASKALLRNSPEAAGLAGAGVTVALRGTALATTRVAMVSTRPVPWAEAPLVHRAAAAPSARVAVVSMAAAVVVAALEPASAAAAVVVAASAAAVVPPPWRSRSAQRACSLDAPSSSWILRARSSSPAARLMNCACSMNWPMSSMSVRGRFFSP